jgi:hypothetical protein
VTTSTSNTMTVPNICMNLEHKNIFIDTWNNLFHGLCTSSCLKINKNLIKQYTLETASVLLLRIKAR